VNSILQLSLLSDGSPPVKYHQSFSVDFHYDVLFTHDIFALQNHALAEVMEGDHGRAMFFLDDGVLAHWPSLPDAIRQWMEHHLPAIEYVTPFQSVPGGENIKNDMAILDRVGVFATHNGICRHSYVIIVGGGAVLDAVGFAASVIHRGLRQIRIPTTVLSQVDSGVGVKNGLNRFGMKNYYGFFAPPFAIVNDGRFLETLSARDWISGLSEAFKVAIIKDRPFLDFLFENAGRLAERDSQAMDHVIRRCAELHLNHIRESGDPFERGLARPLDFGHWAAHRLESMSGHTLRHGEAVAIGVAIDTHCASYLGLVSAEECEYVCNAMKKCGLSLWHDSLLKGSSWDQLEVLAGIEQFREHMGGRLTIAMPLGLGAYTDINDLPHDLVIQAIKAIKKQFDP
jgi:3-dehydroquinate synthase